MTLIGSTVITLLEVVKVEIHGSVYYQITFRPENDGPVEAIRINPEAFYPDPQAGDRVEVNMLMGNIMGAQKISS
jgi:hypothetical protein